MSRNNDFALGAFTSDNGRRYLRRKPNAKIINEYVNWFNELSNVSRVAVFVSAFRRRRGIAEFEWINGNHYKNITELVLFGGIDMIVVICEHVQNCLDSSGDGETPSLQELFLNEISGKLVKSRLMYYCLLQFSRRILMNQLLFYYIIILIFINYHSIFPI